VEVFADAAEVELLVNGKKVGRKKVKNDQAVFRMWYVPGKLEAVAYDASGNEISRSSLQSAKGKADVVIAPEKEQLKPDEVAYINIRIEDKNGIVESNDDRKLSVQVEGGELLGFGSANPCTEEEYHTGTFTTYYGYAQAVIRAGKTGSVKVKVVSGSKVYEKEIPIN
jgi:hypothetical protein